MMICGITKKKPVLYIFLGRLYVEDGETCFRWDVTKQEWEESAPILKGRI